MKKSYTIKDLVFLFLSHIWWIVAAAVVGAVLTFTYTKFAVAKQYQSNISMYVKNSDEQNNQQQGGINNNDLNVSKSLVSTYIVILNNDVVMDEVGDKLLKKYSEDELAEYFTIKDGKITDSSLKACYDMKAADETEVLKITATTKDAKLSADLCNIMADVAPEFLIRVVGAGSVEKIGNAKIYDDAVSPDIPKNTAIGFLAGLMLAVLVILLIDFFDNTVKDTAELTEKYKKPIIGEIQSIGKKERKKEIGTKRYENATLSVSGVCRRLPAGRIIPKNRRAGRRYVFPRARRRSRGAFKKRSISFGTVHAGHRLQRSD